MGNKPLPHESPSTGLHCRMPERIAQAARLLEAESAAMFGARTVSEPCREQLLDLVLLEAGMIAAERLTHHLHPRLEELKCGAEPARGDLSFAARHI